MNSTNNMVRFLFRTTTTTSSFSSFKRKKMDARVHLFVHLKMALVHLFTGRVPLSLLVLYSVQCKSK